MRKISLLFVMLLLVVSGYSLNETISVTPANVTVGENVTISIENTTNIDTTTTLLEILAPSGRYRILDVDGLIALPTAFAVQEPGIHIVQLIDRLLRSVLIQTEFTVEEAISVNVTNTTQNTTNVTQNITTNVTQNTTTNITQNTIVNVTQNATLDVVISLGTGTPRVGQAVMVHIVPAPTEDMQVSIVSETATFKLLGNWIDSPFTPVINGTHKIIITENKNIIEELEFVVLPQLVEEALPPLIRSLALIETNITSISLRMIDSKGRPWDSRPRFYKKNGGKYDIDLPLNSTVGKHLKIRDVPEGEIVDVGISVFEKDSETFPDEVVLDSYAINLDGFNFTNATFTKTAQGDVLYKCGGWNFTLEVCYGGWVKVQNLVPGQDYDISLFPGDPAFIEILATNAIHLDVNKSFISNIFTEIQFLDDVWSEQIFSNEYVRITFEENLTSVNDITVYARNNQSLNTSIEVYLTDGTYITSFPVITTTGYYQIFLTNMSGMHETFDIKIVNTNNTTAYLEFDHIIDPIPATFIDSTEVIVAGGTSLVLTVPSGVQENDLLIAIVANAESEDNTFTAPAGWNQTVPETQVGQVPPSIPGAEVWWWVATDSEPATYTWTASFSSGLVGEMLAYRDVGNLTGDPISQTATAQSASTGCPVAPSVTTAVANETVLYIGFMDDDEVPTTEADFYPASTTGREATETATGGNGMGLGVSDELRGTVGATGTRAFQNCQAAEEWGAITISLLPSNSPSTTPTNIQCDGTNDCDITVASTVEINASGSTDVEGDSITYFIEAALDNITFIQNSTDFSKIGTVDLADRTTLSFEDFEAGFTTWTNTGGDDNDCWQRDSGGTPSGGTGPSTGAESTTWYIFYEASTGGGTACPSSAGETAYLLGPDIDFDSNNSVNISFWYHQLGGALGTVSFQLENQGGGGWATLWSSQGPSQDLWINQLLDLSAYDGTGVRGVRFEETGDTGFAADSAVDEINLTSREPSGATNETNTTATTYNNVNSNYASVSSITITVEVDSYTPEASVTQSTNDPDLYLEIYNGSDWINIGAFNLNETYTTDVLNTTDYNFSLTTTDASILAAWESSANQDVRIKGIFMDYYDSTTIDEINYTNVYVTINGTKWIEIGTHTESTDLDWDTSSVPEQNCINLRSRTSDLLGSGLYSSYFTKDNCLKLARNPSITSPGLNITLINQSEHVQLNATISDELAMSVVASLLFPNGTLINFSMTEDVGNTWILDMHITNLTGIHNFTNIFATDGLGNVNNTAYTTLTFEVTASPPAIFDLLFPINNTASSNLQPNMSWEQTIDDHFDNYTLIIDTDPAFGSPDFTYYNFQIDIINRTLNSPLLNNIAYYWRVIAYDVFGNSRQSTNDFVYITDNILPTVTLHFPASFDYVTTSEFEFNYTPLDANLANCTLYTNQTGSFDINQTNTSPVSGQYNYFESNLTDGIYFWNVMCYDRADFSAFAVNNLTFTMDTTPPGVYLEHPLNNTENVTANNIDFFYNVTDLNSDVASCELIINNTVEDTDTSITEDAQQSFKVFVANGNYTWSVNCTDDRGHEGSSLDFNLTVNSPDSEPPNILLNYPDEDDYVGTTNISFNYTADDATGINNCSIYINNTFNSTNQTPVIPGIPNIINISNFEDGDYNWYMNCYDNFTYIDGNSTTRNFTVDTILPTVALSTPADNEFVDSDVQFNHTPNDIYLDSCTLYTNTTGTWAITQVNNTPTNAILNSFYKTISDGIWLWNVVCADLAGNENTDASNRTVNIDTIPPQYTNINVYPASPATYTPGQEYEFNITWVDNFTIDKVIIEHNFTGTLINDTLETFGSNIYNYSYSDLGAGTYRYRWFANDTQDNRNQTNVLTYIVNRATIDVNLTLNKTRANVTISDVSTIALLAELLIPSSGYIELYLDGERINTGSAPLNNDTIISTAGVYNVTAVYNETANYSQGQETHYIIAEDSTPPIVTLSTPANDTFWNTSFTVDFVYSVTDSNSTVSSCELIVNGAPVQTDNTIIEGVDQTFAYPLSNGNHTWSVNCTTVFDAEGASQTYDIEVSVSSAGASLAQPDAAAPGMFVRVQFFGQNFEGFDVLTTNTTDIIVGPSIIMSESGEVVTTGGKIMTTSIFVKESAAEQDVELSIRGEALSNIFKIITPITNSGDFTGASGTVVIGDGNNGTRTFGGTIVLDSLIIPSGVNVVVDMSDPDADGSNGNQGYLPVYVLVDGPVNISGTLNVSGQTGADGIIDDPGGAGGPGGPGGAGGGTAGLDATEGSTTQPDGGAGFTGGAGGTCEHTPECIGGTGGIGSGGPGGSPTLNEGGTGGTSFYGTPTAPTSGDDNGEDVGPGSGGGTGWPYGSGGTGGQRGGTSGQGGGEGGNTAGGGGSGTGGGGGGHATTGNNGIDGGAGDGTGGTTYGNPHLTPLAGGSGGAGGGSEDANPDPGDSGGGGGGGGGALLLYAKHNITITGTITATGGPGGLAGMATGALGGSGGGGSGGSIIIQSHNTTITGTIDTSGGTGGTSAANNGGTGGLGRVRIDGNQTTLTSTSGSNFTGPIITSTNSTHVTGRGAGSTPVWIYVQDGTNTATFTDTTAADGTYSVPVTLYVAVNYITVIQNTSNNNVSVMSSAALARYDHSPPNVTLFTPTNNSHLNYTNVTFVYNVTDYQLSSCHLYLNSTGSWEINESVATTENGVKNFSVNMSEGTYLWNVGCIDQTGNEGFAIDNRTFTVDITPPNIVLNAPLNNTNQTSTVVFNWTVSDASPNTTCSFYIDGTLDESGIIAITGVPVIEERNLSVSGIVEWNVSCVDLATNANNSLTYEFFHLVQPIDITSFLLDEGVVTNWSSVSGADSYNIYISTNYSAGRFSTPNITGLTDTNWTDTGHYASQQRYYWVSAVRTGAEAINETPVGKYTTYLPINLSLISFPLIPPSLTLKNGTPAGFEFGLQPVCAVSLWDRNTSQYRRTDWNGTHFTPASGSESFTFLKMNRSYWLETNSSCNLTFTNRVPSGIDIRGLDPGFNLLSWNTIFNVTLPTDSNPPLINHTPNISIQAINRFNAISQLFEVTILYVSGTTPWGWFPSFNNQDFLALDPTIGYSFDATQATNWTFDPFT